MDWYYSGTIMRYFVELAYNGQQYCGWQRQPEQPSVQQTLEEALSLVLRVPTEVMGCGRTDTGVHASQYFVHLDVNTPLDARLLGRLNKVLPKDIALYRAIEVAEDAHVRFDAYERAYAYHVDLRKNPFAQGMGYARYANVPLDRERLQAAAALLLEFEAFFPFCKTNSDAKTMNCKMLRSEWEWREAEQRLVYHVAANRFLRGMVRLIVGMCMNVATGKLSLEHVRSALEQQTRLEKSWSVPADGLFLTTVKYPYV